MSTGPQTYKYIDCPQLPQGFRAYSAKVKENFDWVAAAVNKLVQLYSSISQALATKAPLASPDFSGRIGVPAVVLDPGDPKPGQAWAFVLVATGVSAELVVRHNDAGTVRTVTIPLT